MPNQASPSLSLPEGVTVSGVLKPGYERILTSDALEFVASMARRFEPQRRQFMDARAEQQAKLDGGALPDFCPRPARSVKTTGRLPASPMTCSTGASRLPGRQRAK